MDLFIHYVLIFLFVLIEFLGICGNLLVIIAVQFDARMRRSLTNQLIVRVALCDLFILLLNLPDLIQLIITNDGHWMLGRLSCQLIRTSLVLVQYASVLTMCALTVERFIGIVYPLRSKVLHEKKHLIRITIAVWFISVVCAAPNLMYLKISRGTPRLCLLEYVSDDPTKDFHRYLIHKSLESIFFYFLPLFLQLFCYVRIARQLFHVDQSLQSSFKKNDEDPSTRRPTITTDFSSWRVNLHQNERKFSSDTQSRLRCKAWKSRRNVIKMLALVVIIYFVSFSPQVIFFLLFQTGLIAEVPSFLQTPHFVPFTMLLITTSSASNPLVYAIFCSKFRLSFKKILRRLWPCSATNNLLTRNSLT